MKTRFVVLGFLALLIQACGDATGPPTPARVVVTPGTATVEALGETKQFSARVEDGRGRTIPGAAVTWSSSRAEVAVVDETGLATAVKAGNATIRATTEGVSGVATLRVEPRPAAMTKVAGDEQTGGLLQPLPIKPTVEVRDSRENPVEGFQVHFIVVSGGGSVSPVSVATGADGKASTTWTLGSSSTVPNVLEAKAGEVTVQFTATADPSALVILTGELDDGRATLPYRASLLAVGGSESGYAWSVAEGSLPPGVVLDPDGLLAGTPTTPGSFPFQLRVEDDEGNSTLRSLSLRVCEEPLALARGERTFFDATPAGACGFFLPSGSFGDRYRVGILYPESSSADSTDVATATFTAARVVAPDLSPWEEPAVAPPLPFLEAYGLTESHQEWLRELPPSFQEALRIEEATEALHHRMREAEKALLRELGPRVRPLPDRPSLPRLLAAQASSPEKMTLDTRVGDCEAPGPQVTALKIAENDHLAIYQDSTQNASDPLSLDHAWMLLDYYRDYGKPVIDHYFDGVSDINNDGRVVVFVTPIVEELREGAAAFVWAGDFLSKADCPPSNEMELVYFNHDVIKRIADGNYQALATLVHEVKHVSSLYKGIARFYRTGGAWGFHPLWAEEGRAEIAAEMSSRLAWEAAGGPPVGAMIRRSDKVITKESYGVLLRLARTILYLSSQPNAVVVSPLGAADYFDIYGAGWHYHRWLGDAYGNASAPLADSTLFRALNDSIAPPGVQGILEVTGRGAWRPLLEEYGAALMLNGTGAPPPPRAFATYDLPDITTGLLVEQPPGRYPWPVNVSGDTPTAPFASDSDVGAVGPSGIRVFDLTSDGTGLGLDIQLHLDRPGGRVVVVRLN